MADAPLMFDQLPDDNAAQNAPEAQAPVQQSAPQAGQQDFDALQDDSAKFETTGQQVKAGLEGFAKGVIGPAAPYLEKHALHVVGSDIRGREEANPITSAVGEGAGLVTSGLTGMGEGAVMAKAGEAAAAATGVADSANLVAKVGSSAVQSAAEMAILQGSDEMSKMVLNDPSTTSESALANIGLSAALGAGGGAMMGMVSPLWKATVGSKVEKVLGGLRDHLDGVTRLPLPEDFEKATQTLGIQLPAEMRAAMSGSPRAAEIFNELREVQHPSIVAGLKNLQESVDNSVLQSIGKTPEEIANYSEAEGGRHAMDTFSKEYKEKFEPISKEFDSITGPFKESPVTSQQIGALSDKISQVAMDKGYLGVDIPQNKIVESILSRLPRVKTAEDYMKLNTQLSNMTSGDFKLTGVRRDLQKLILEGQHNALETAIGKDAPELMGRYTSVRAAYSDLARISEHVGQELGLGKFVGPKTLLQKIGEKRSPEEFLRRLSPKGNADILEFLGKHFPDTMESIRDNELKQIMKPAVLAAKGDSPLNSKILNNAIEKGLAGQPERIKFALPGGALERIQAAKTVMDSIPAMKSSGTAGWQQKMMAYVPQSALSAVALVTGHNPIMGYIGGHIGKLLARDVPDAMKLSLLRFMSSSEPIKAEGFKSMLEYLANTAKGQTMLTRATGNVFKTGAQVLTDKEMPTKEEREKLNDVVEKVDKDPEMLMRLTNSHVGHYLPNHQVALTESTARAVQYLQSIKPRPFQASPLDKPIEPSKDQMARYNRAMDIANQPAIVLQHIKNGTLQANDLKDMNAMYPALMKQMQDRLTQHMGSSITQEQNIPYKTKMGMSLFLGQPMDSTMEPMSIQAAQPVPKVPPQQGPVSKKSSTKDLGKSNKTYMTPIQKAESRNNDE